MPMYEYHCDACGAEFEQSRSITDDSTPPCETCGSDSVHRLISLSSFQLKGSGWYVTDYGGKHSQAAQPAEGGIDSSTSGGKEASEKKKDKVCAAGGSGSGPPS